jgi:anhydro-N-acetylmuramic acid kinase
MVIGVNSGTSMDGLDIGLFEISRYRGEFRLKSKGHVYCRFPADLHSDLLSLATATTIDKENFLTVDKKFSLFIGSRIKSALPGFGTRPTDIGLIGSHGQTIAHFPDRKTTLQIGDPSIIASHTGITTVGDFRRADIGAGGEGAPLSPSIHSHLFRGDKARAIVNIGGIANVSYIPPTGSRRKPYGFDTGPGNILIDSLVRKYYGKRYDRGGSMARRGKIDHGLLGKLMEDDFVNLAPPKSTGREYYGDLFVNVNFPSNRNSKDLIATAAEFTARAITVSIKKYLPRIDEVIVCGGGAMNGYLVERIQFNLGGIEAFRSEALDLPAVLVECAGFALLGYMALGKFKSDLTGTTGSRKPVVLGKVCYA